MAKETIVLEAKLDTTQAQQSVGSFRSQLKAATADLVLMSEKFGLSSTEAQNAAKKVAGLKDAIGDAKALADTFNPDKKFVALSGALQGVTAGFSAYSGAMGLLGSESKEVEKLLLKVQSAMALQQGISGIAGAVDSFKLLGASIVKSSAVQKIFTAGTVAATTVQKLFGVAVETTSTAFKVLRTAIITTGIGALVVGLGVLIDKLNLFGGAADDAAKKQVALNDEIERGKKVTNGYIQAVDRTTDLLVKQALIEGKSAQAIYEIRKNGFYERTKLLFQEKDDQIKIGGDLIIINEEIAKNNIEYQNLVLDNRLRIANEERALEDKKDADNDARTEKRKAKEAKDFADKAQKKIDDEAFVNQLLRDVQYEKDNVAWAAMEKEAADKTYWRMYDETEQQYYDDLEISNAEAKAKAEKEIEDEKIRQREENFQKGAALLDNLSDLVGKHTVAGKALAISSTIIQTYQGATAALTSFSTVPIVGTALGFVAAAAVVASGLKSIQKIASVKVPGKGGGGGAPSISLPGAPVTPKAQTTQLNQQSINAVGNAASRAYVLESDVSGNQERITRLNRAARIN